MEKFKDISVSIKQHLAYVEINRPPNNFFDANLIQQIADAYESLDEENECRVILLKSEGKNFCAGANFKSSAYVTICFFDLLRREN